MDRRRFLVGDGGFCITAVSGCLGITADAAPMDLTLATVDRDPEPLSFEIALLDERVTADDLPVLDIATTNTGEKPVKWSYGGGIGNLPFPHGIHSGGNELVIGLTNNVRSQLTDTSRGCARVDHFVTADGFQTTALEPDETIEERYAVAGVGGNLSGVCPEPGTYRLEYDFGEYGAWGFELRLE